MLRIPTAGAKCHFQAIVLARLQRQQRQRLARPDVYGVSGVSGASDGAGLCDE